jgi:uncharacterized surface protein with fasciclin (FAS1) repeats
MMRFIKAYLTIAIVFTVIICGCKKWEDHTAINNQDLTKDLYTAVAGNPDLSKFAQLVTQAGLDSLLKSSKTYTVWAPSNAALATLDPAIANDAVKLKSFLLNHVSNQLYFTRDAQTVKRIGMLNGKYNNFLNNKLEDATITSADKYVKNGVLHVVDKYIPVLPNLWDYINSTTAQYIQNNYIAGLNYTTFDPALAVIDSISSSTGQPVYHPGTGIVIKNGFNENVFDTRKEEKQYTFFVVENAGFTLKSDSLKPYFSTTSTVKTDSLAKWNTVKDVMVDTLYPTISSLPPVLYSKSGIAIPVNTSTITSTTKVSNGIVYVISSSGINTSSKFLQNIIQGEIPSGFLSDKTANTNYRVRVNPAGQIYRDILISGHGVSGYYVFYRLNAMPSMKYNIYGLAVNDFQTTNIFQSIGVQYFTPPATYTPVVTTPTPLNWGVPLKSVAGAYNEVLMGSFTSTLFGTLDIRIISGGTTLGSAGTGPINLDYLRIVPVP